MKHTDRFASLTRYPLTIGSPFGDVRLSYELDTVPCSDCGKYHAAVNVLSVPDGLSKKQARVFLHMFPVVLEEAALLVDTFALFEASRPVGSVS